MTRNVSLSVVVPCYNVEEFIADTVTSLAQNARGDFEFIFVDDASTDGTAAALRALTENLENSRIVTHRSNQGVSATRNDGIAAAEGRYLTFLDGDDWLAPGYLERLVGAIAGLDVDFLRTDHVQATGVKREIRRAPEGRRDVALDPRDSILPAHRSTMVDYCFPPAGIYHRRLLDRGLLTFHCGLRTAEDRHWIWRLHRRADSYAVAGLHGFFYRRGVGNSLTQIGDDRQLDFIPAFEMILAELADDPEAERLRPKAIRNFCAIILHHLQHHSRLERGLARTLRQRSREALRRIPEADLRAGLDGMSVERAARLRRLRSGLAGVAA
ncbi:glycosyltransferase family 2 protein [Streptomyces specialis]|uniref:glycosyltransferase family 2 protein n=1 Tax=Streptomyces specialis TaxID=498367 RepID=UPI00073EEE6B|nr:glycosyltransferase family 2 protein [Streptomyces specialis]